MARRLLRILLLIASAALMALTLLSQFFAIIIKVPANAIQFEQQGITFLHSRFLEGWETRCHSEIDTWAAQYLFLSPHLGSKGGLVSAFLPWWLLLIAWGALAALAWHFTRTRKLRAFPVQESSGR